MFNQALFYSGDDFNALKGLYQKIYQSNTSPVDYEKEILDFKNEITYDPSVQQYVQLLLVGNYKNNRQWAKCEKAVDEFQESHLNKEENLNICSCYAKSLINQEKCDKLKEKLEKKISSQSDEEKQLGYFFLGELYSEKKDFVKAGENYEKCSQLKTYEDNDKFQGQLNQNYAQSLMEQTKYKEAIEKCKIAEQKFGESVPEKTYLIMSNCYAQLKDIEDRENNMETKIKNTECTKKENYMKDSIESLKNAKEQVDKNGQPNNEYTDSELQIIMQKFNKENMNYMQNVIRKYKLLKDVPEENRESVEKELQNLIKKASGLSKDAKITPKDNENCNKIYKSNLSQKSQLKEEAMIIIEDLTQNNEQLKQYCDIFQRSASGCYSKAKTINVGFKLPKSDSILVQGAEQVLSMIPMFGSTLSAIVSAEMTIKRKSQAIVEFALNNQDFDSYIIQICAKVIQNKLKQNQIMNLTQNEESIKEYTSKIGKIIEFCKNTKKNIEKKVEKEKKKLSQVQLQKETAQRILANKEAQELISTYVSTGYLMDENDEKKIEKSVEFILADKNQKEKLQETAEEAAAKDDDQEEEKEEEEEGSDQSKCCSIF